MTEYFESGFNAWFPSYKTQEVTTTANPDDVYNRLVQRDVNEVFDKPSVQVTETFIENEDIISNREGFIYRYRKPSKINFERHYRFIKEYQMTIDRIVLESVNFYDEDDPNRDRSDPIRGFDSLLPIVISINGFKFPIDSFDQTRRSTIGEYGYNSVTLNGLNPEEVSLNIYQGIVNRTIVFKTASFSDLSVEIDMNGNLTSDYYNNLFYMTIFNLDGYEENPRDYLYRTSGLANLRVIGTIRQIPDLEMMSREPRLSRVEMKPLNLSTLAELLRSLKEESLEDHRELMERYFVGEETIEKFRQRHNITDAKLIETTTTPNNTTSDPIN